MTKRPDGHVFSVALDTLTKKPLNQADSAALQDAATELWYSDNDLSAELATFLAVERTLLELRRAGYLLERLTRFSCVTPERASEAEEGLKQLQPYVPPTGEPLSDAHRRVDALAIRWGLEEGLGTKVQTLLPLQTRHYEAEQRRH
ncbi:hypothetical protein ACVW0Y_001004 [Pseudomonas sp. TE3786]